MIVLGKSNNKRGLVKRGLVDEATALAKLPALAKIHAEGDSEPEYEPARNSPLTCHCVVVMYQKLLVSAV